MPTIITNSNRIDLVDPIKGKNKSITIDEESQRLIVDDGTGESWDISGDTDETVGALARQLRELAADVTAIANKVDQIGSLENLSTDVKTTIVDAINDTWTNAVIARAHANTISDQLDSLITQANTWANNQLLPTVNSTVIAQGTTAAIATTDWEAAQYTPSAAYPYSLTIHTGVDSTDLADNPADLIASGRIMFNPTDLPNASLASFCEVNYNTTSTEYELVAWSKEQLNLSAISWELIIARDISASEVPDLELAKPVQNSNESTEA